jgi:GT2 family glycosyltransferase
MKKFEEGARAVIDRRRMYRPATFYARLSDHLYDLRYADYVPANAWIMEKALVEALGGFDENLHIAEDVDLGDRIKAAGVEIALAERAVHSHRGEAPTLTAGLRRSYAFGRGITAYWLKDPRKRTLTWLARSLALFWGLFCPPVFLYAVVKTVGKRYRWALRRNMEAKYLTLEPLLYAANQLAFQAGAAVELAHGLLVDEKLLLRWKGLKPSIEPRQQ